MPGRGNDLLDALDKLSTQLDEVKASLEKIEQNTKPAVSP